jgi:predicted ATP-dependent endonuclease of OLD family
VLCALNVFFRETENATTDVVNLTAEDFHQKITAEPIRIVVTFIDLNKNAQKDFKDYFRQGKLIISAIAEFDPLSQRAEVRQFGQRLGMEDFRSYFEAVSAGRLVEELRRIYGSLKERFKELPEIATKGGMTEALQKYESEHPDLGTSIPSEDQFYGVSRGANRLARYVQWVFIPAVKDVTAEQTENKASALGKLLARTVRVKLKFEDVIKNLQEKTEREYQGILAENQGALKELEKTLGEKLGLWAHPAASVKLEWQKDSKRSVQIEQPSAKTIAGEGTFEGNLARLGHGFQRSYLLALLQVLATAGSEGDVPRLILACEEPELYQHPPQARHLASVFEQLSTQDAQILVGTHNPAFVTGRGFESVRLVRFSPVTKGSQVKQLTYEDIGTRLGSASGEKPLRPEGTTAKLHQALQPGLNELFFTRNLILVEGAEDAAVITSWMVITERWVAFRQKGLHIVPVNGKSYLARPLALAQGLGIPVYTVFDADGNDSDHQAMHKKDNEVLLNLLGGDAKQPFPANTVWDKRYTLWPHNIGETIKAEIPSDKLKAYEEKANLKYGNAGGLKKNSLQIGEKLQLAFQDGIRPPSLERLCEAILSTVES